MWAERDYDDALPEVRRAHRIGIATVAVRHDERLEPFDSDQKRELARVAVDAALKPERGG